MSNKTNKEQTALEQLLIKHGIYEYDARLNAVVEEYALQLSAHCKEKEEEIRMLKLENDRLYLKLDDYERII